jgi:hypothetical protein
MSAGMSIPRGDFGKVADNGYHVTGLVALGSRSAPFGWRLEGSFNELNYKNAFNTSAKARVLSATANAVFGASGESGAYIIGRFGIYHASAECSTCTTTSTRGGVNGGVGFRWGLSGFSAFVESRYHYIGGPSDPTNGGVKGSNTQIVPISFGVRF